MESVKLALVLPCFNEEEVLPSSIHRLTLFYDELIQSGTIAPESRLVFVNDGSKDRTWEIIEEGFKNNHYVCGVNLAGNVGHQNAILAGMTAAKDIADAVVTIDADLQDDIHKIPEMLDKYREGCDVVYGVKNERKADSWFKRTTAILFYKLMKALGGKSVFNHADFRLLSKRAVNEICKYRERNLFLRGIIPLIGYKTDVVYEDLSEREAGKSKYTLKKMLNLAIDGVTSFSIKPVRLILLLGILFILLSIIILTYVLICFLQQKTVSGWTSIIMSLWFIGGCVLAGLGIIGEYIGKIYLEVKDRPRYNVEKVILQ
jgi:glycosyltransferase involved in cell wall biosynthesis